MLSSKHALIPSSVIGSLPDDTSVVLAMPVSCFWKRARLGLSKCLTSAFFGYLFLPFDLLYTPWLYVLLPFFSPLQARRHFPFCSFPLQFNSNHLSPLFDTLFSFLFFFFPSGPRGFPAVCGCHGF